MISSAQPIANHLWQSTVFALVAGILLLALRKDQARVRYRVWLIASVKFLVPFSLLIGVGAHFVRTHKDAVVHSSFYSLAEQASQPFTQQRTNAELPGAQSRRLEARPELFWFALQLIWTCGSAVVLFRWWREWQQLSTAVQGSLELTAGREVDMLRRLERCAPVRSPIRFVVSQQFPEPGIFGILRPVLLWPVGFSEQLEDPQLESILVHEICHAQRRDNLAAALHRLVEGIFWFHPLVWWLGARMLAEREQACDEEVLQQGNEPRAYAEGILKTCQYCVQSSQPCVSGVTSSDLKERIVRIMTGRTATRLHLSKKLLLSISGVVAIVLPILFGLAHATESRAAYQNEDAAAKLPSFEVASIKPDKAAGEGPVMVRFMPDGFMATNLPLRMLIREAYGVEENQIMGAPAWVGSHSYDIEAKVDNSAVEELKKLSLDQRRAMLRPLLADRFKLQTHRETRELPVYELSVAKSGAKIREAKPGDTYPNGIKGPDGGSGPGLIWFDRDKLTCQAVTSADLARLLSQRLGHNVIDKTGLTGKYDVVMPWPQEEEAAPMSAADGQQNNAAAPDTSGPSLFTALQDALGLRLESHKDAVEVLVVDHIEAPSEN